MTRITDDTMVFWVPGQMWIQDVAKQVDGKWFTDVFNTPMEVLKQKEPTVQLITYREFEAAHSELARSRPVRISEQQYWDALEVLPPEDWRHGSGSESFKMMERYSGNYTRMYLKRGKIHWQMTDDCRKSHVDICELVDAEEKRSFAYVTSPQTITDLDGAKLYLQALVNAGLSHQLDEPAAVSLSDKLSDEQCWVIDQNISNLYTLADLVEKYGDPISLLIEIDPDR